MENFIFCAVLMEQSKEVRSEVRSIFNKTRRQTIFLLNKRVKLFCAIRKFLTANTFRKKTFYLIFLHLSKRNFKTRNS